MKSFTAPEMTFKHHSRSSATSPGHAIRDQKCRLHLFSDKTAQNDLEDQSHLKRQHITFY